MTRWGLAATIKAPTREILEFAAYHVERGAHRLYLYLDAPAPEAYRHLKGHPKVRVVTCDDAYWRGLGRKRPGKHQLRQTVNATQAYRRKPEVDWLIHMDVDEFLWPRDDIGAHLGSLSNDTLCARVRPMEALAGPEPHFKAFIPAGAARDRIVARLYPTYGRYVKGGFLSHVAGKLFVRTGLGALTIKIHNAFRGDEMNPGSVELDAVELCHCHGKSWDQWIAAYRYRVQKGSYRAELPPAQPREKGGLSMHELLTTIEAEEGEAGLRAFYEELCEDTPRLRKALQRESLLRRCDLDLDRALRVQFPDFR